MAGACNLPHACTQPVPRSSHAIPLVFPWQVPTAVAFDIMPAAQFHVPEVVPMGTVVNPVSLVEEAPAIPVAEQVYYYQE